MGKCRILVLLKSKVLISGSRWKTLNQFGGVLTVGVRCMRRHDNEKIRLSSSKKFRKSQIVRGNTCSIVPGLVELLNV